ncbi:gamma-glutamyltransferase [Novosphingobium sp.]|uniref:gamma-glutamyltransferase n=1 Tax=Novosphingobium sp. TaxID=1874826 RepID=UPI00263703DB|nr:gamma-glutamyltransferase [Novosphingobium sp.]
MVPGAEQIINPGPRRPVTGLTAAWSVDHSAVGATVRRILDMGGNAFDAGVAGALTECAVSPHLTCLAGALTGLLYVARTGEYHQLESTGTMPEGLPAFSPLPSQGARSVASIPGSIAGLQALHERFGTLPWAELCADAIAWSEEGHLVSSFEYGVLVEYQSVITASPAGRALFRPGGLPVNVGERLRNPAFAQTLCQLAEIGPEHMISGDWARAFVEQANRIGWRITLADMAVPARWLQPLRFNHRGHEIVAPAPPQMSGVMSALALGIMRHQQVESGGYLTADHLFHLSHALRHAFQQCVYIGDPDVCGYDWAPLLDDAMQAQFARLLNGLRPKIDLTRHTALRGPVGDLPLGFTNAIGEPTPHDAAAFGPRSGSCELSIVDAQGNWLQLMTTCAAGGIPGQVIGGVPMHGSAYGFSALQPVFHAKFVSGVRARGVVGHTFILEDGKPRMGLGTPGAPCLVVPQILSNMLDFGLDPQAAIDAPRCSMMDDQESFVAEDRISSDAVSGLAAMGVRMRAMAGLEWHTGSIQACWREGDRLAATTDPRRTGVAGGHLA